MALVNAGIELARRKHRVLLVDFDLEAPGLDTFKALGTREPSLGIVDFVHTYLSSGTIGDVDRYVSECFTEPESGDIWLMPAGGSKSGYAGLLQSIDWGELYANQDGFLLMENLKQQWMDKIQPDYVLIDSRTGHTDVGGICTRQLPDAVAIFYFPNEQNLRGVSRVVREVRSERSGPRKKDIKLHFIMSNVPDLDDEHQILEKGIQAFRVELELQEDPMMVHRYDSISLLNQEIFTQSRPNSRLANEYREIVGQIVKENLGDREGALSFLRKIERRTRRRTWDEKPISHEVTLQLEKIEKVHKRDSEISYQLALLYHREQQLERATSLYQRSIDLGHDDPEIFVDRASALAHLENKYEANRDAFQALESNKLSPRSISRALKFIDASELHHVANSNAVVSLDIEQRIRLVLRLYFESEVSQHLAIQLVRPIMDVKPTDISEDRLRRELGLIYISMGEFTRAKRLFTAGQIVEDDITTAFNLAIASWGESGNPSHEDFEKVIKLHESEQLVDDHTDDANYLQCIALAYWAIGKAKKGLEFTEKAELALDKYGRSLSCWCYLYLKRDEFLQDIREMERLIDGDQTVRPAFLKEEGESIVHE